MAARLAKYRHFTNNLGVGTILAAMKRFIGYHGLRLRVKATIGGAAVTSKWAAEIGADGYSRNAIDALERAKILTGKGTAPV